MITKMVSTMLKIVISSAIIREILERGRRSDDPLPHASNRALAL